MCAGLYPGTIWLPLNRPKNFFNEIKKTISKFIKLTPGIWSISPITMQFLESLFKFTQKPNKAWQKNCCQLNSAVLFWFLFKTSWSILILEHLILIPENVKIVLFFLFLSDSTAQNHWVHNNLWHLWNLACNCTFILWCLWSENQCQLSLGSDITFFK